MKKLCAFLKKLGIIGNMPVQKPIITIAEIEKYLKSLKNGNWIRVPGFFATITPSMNGNNVNFSAPTRGIILVTYYNSVTAEVKTFVAKYTDVPERDNWF